jgi:hypothetical protein
MRLSAKVFLGLVLLTGCDGGGVRFSDIPEFNKALPEDFKRRVLWNETDIFKYNLEQLAGHVIYAKGPAGEFDRGPRYLKPDKHPALKVVESGEVYHSKIDSGAQAEGNYLAFAAKLSGDQTASVSIADTAQAFIPYEDVPVENLLAEVQRPIPSGSTKRYYIQGVLLATVLTQYGAKINADASGVAGTVFGAKGKVYREDETVSRDFRISLLLIDIDRLAQLSAESGVEASTSTSLLESARADGFTVNRLTGINASASTPLVP